MNNIYVTKSFLPPLDSYNAYLEKIWQSGQLTNQGPMLEQFEDSIKKKLEVDNFHFVTNGTIALQIALRALDITEGEIITTPFSYVATTSSILWERCRPVFVDIEPDTFCIDVDKIEAAITPETKAIMPVHVFGFPCDVEAIGQLAKKHQLRVIYDAAHAFGVKYKGKSLLDYGDVSTCSFHSTKLLHTIEGGGILTPHANLSDKIELQKRFGHNGDDHITLGINAKANELQAAMGLVNLSYLDEIISRRKHVSDLYTELLSRHVSVPSPRAGMEIERNYAYYPVVFDSESRLLKTFMALNKSGIFPRRYFYPSLNTLPYLGRSVACPVSEDVSKRVACLPLYDSLADSDVERISKIVIASLND